MTGEGGGGEAGGGWCVFFFPSSNELSADGTLPLSAESSTHPRLLCVCVYVVGGLKKKIEWHLHCMDGSKIKIKRNKVIKGDKNGVNKDRRSQFWVERRVNMIRRWWLIEKRKVENKKGSKT